MMTPLRIFIGYDPRESVAWHVLAQSIMLRASQPVTIMPLIQSQLRAIGLYTRERDKYESTEFSFTRFLVPYLSGYGGLSLFLDCDMVCCGDIYQLVKLARKDRFRAVYCVQHPDYVPSTKLKFLHQVQTSYPRKNWSSVMLFRNKYCTALTPAYVNTATGKDLHRMVWAGADDNIGVLPPEWNHLVGEQGTRDDGRLYHYTLGTPCFPEYAACDHADKWLSELEQLLTPLARP